MNKLILLRRFSHYVLLLALIVLWLVSGRTAALADGTLSATDFLKQSMVRYQSLTSFQAECIWNDTFGGISLPQASGIPADVRTITYLKPNQFKVISSHASARFIQTSVSDGKHLVEYSNMSAMPAMSYTAPTSLAAASSMQMQHPMFCGTLLYRFFGGPDNLNNLAALNKMPIVYEPDVTVAGEPCKTVRLYAQEMYGHTNIAISTRDHLIRRITYDSAPLIAMMATMYQNPQIKKMLKGKSLKVVNSQIPTSSVTTEEYRKIVVDQPIAQSFFDTTLPKGRSVQDMSAMTDGTPPNPLGTVAPDFTVTSVSTNQPVKLSSLRGQVVLLDFWATWCPPCRKSLPETQAFSTQLGAKGLAVMTISDEDQPTIARFLKTNHYTFPAYRDGAGNASKAYKVSGIPTLVVIDKAGNLVAYMVGLQEHDTVTAALKKAGLQVSE